MQIPAEILNSTTFIGRRANEDESFEYQGSGFFATHTHSEDEPGFSYLITARHVVSGLHGNFAACIVNLKSGGTKEIPIPSNEGWYFHTGDSDVDIAVLPIDYLGDDIDYKSIPLTMSADFPRNPSVTFGYGDSVFFPGLFTKLSNKKTYIVRCGNIAMMPAGKVVPIVLNGVTRKTEAYVIEARSYGGMSGSPVFVRQSNYLAGPDGKPFTSVPFLGYGSFYLLGIGIGHWEIDETAINDNISKQERERLHMGLSVVAPSYKLTEILNQPELENIRRKSKMERR